jgi:hypothetical protein
MRHIFEVHTLLQLLTELLLAALVYTSGLLWIFFTREPMGMKLRTRVFEYVQQSIGR